MRRVVPIAVLLALFLCPHGSPAADPFRGPWKAAQSQAAGTGDPLRNRETADSLLFFYRKAVSPLSQDRCPMTPSCSTYAHECLSHYGFVRGFIMTADRLVRCGRDEVRLSPRVWTPAGPRTLDPVERNDLWGPDP